ncbi:unnamed protein product, partial [Phaeothamnion confervicola]
EESLRREKENLLVKTTPINEGAFPAFRTAFRRRDGAGLGGGGSRHVGCDALRMTSKIEDVRRMATVSTGGSFTLPFVARDEQQFQMWE